MRALRDLIANFDGRRSTSEVVTPRRAGLGRKLGDGPSRKEGSVSAALEALELWGSLMTGSWWGEFTVPEGETRHWEIGPIQLWISRTREEWRIATQRASEPLARALSVARPSEGPPEEASLQRYGFRKTSPEIVLSPAAADRRVVAKASTPSFVPAGEAIKIYVSSPLWIQIRAPGHDAPLFDEPCFRPSDTWFGPSTLEGELCYATKTAARLHLENLPLRPHRAVSVVHVSNRADSQLALERLNLPLSSLSLFAGDDGNLWTEEVTLDREEEGELARVSLGKGAPPEAGNAKPVAGPREHHARSALMRAFGGLFGLRGGTSHERVVG
jgi:hypothetical protein